MWCLKDVWNRICCHKRCLGGQTMLERGTQDPLGSFLDTSEPPKSPQWSPNEHHQVAPSDHPSHPIYKPSSCLIMYWHSQNCHRNLKKLRYSFYNSDRSSIYVMMLILLAVSKIHNWPVIIQQHTHYNFWWFWPQKVHDWMCSCIYIVC